MLFLRIRCRIRRLARLLLLVAAGLAAGAATPAPPPATDRPPHILLRSSWQSVNIGDVGHTPGVLSLLAQHFPAARLTLWPADQDPKVHAMLRAAFPQVRIVRGNTDDSGNCSSLELTAAFAECDFLLHGSGPSVVARRNLEAWARTTGKPYGIYGVTVDPVSSLEGVTSEGDTIAALAARIERLPPNHLDPALRAILERARFVFCRDSLSERYLRAQQVAGPRIAFAPDGAFGIQLRNEIAATTYLRDHALEAGQFICVIPRLRYTPYHLMRQLPPTQRDLDRAALSARHAETDLAKVRELIIRWVRTTGKKVLVCPEVTYQIDTGRDFVVNRLPADVKSQVILRDTFWLPDEACSVFARARAVVALDNHSPIFALTLGTPAMYVRQPTDTIKGQMWNDVGLGDWFCEIGEVSGEQLAERVLAIERDVPAARARTAQIMRFVREQQAKSMAVVRAEVGAAARADPAGDGGQAPALGVLPWTELLSRVARDPTLGERRDQYLAEARNDAAKPILRRPRTLPELRAWRVALKYNERPPHMSKLADEEWATFCFSQGDNGAGSLLKFELPRLAAAAVLTQDEALFARVLAQLRELAAWSPLERRGWSLRNTNLRLKQDDGAWLGTGWLVRAIVDTLDVLPPGKLPPDLRAALRARLEAEVALMEEDWATKRAPYLRGQAVQSNQWILPHEALVRAILFLGVEQHRAAYERGVAHLLRSLDAQGRKGEFVEGLRYAGLSLESFYSIARATARAGDERLRAHPFLQQFPTWLVHHFQPGGFLINAFDAPHSSRGHLSRDQALLATAALVTGNPHAFWGLRTRAGFGSTLDAMAAATLPASLGQPPPLFAHYPIATRLNWRSSWDDDTATGLWIRGGHATDYHDHMDRGHVNFIIGQRPILIESGTLTYAEPRFPTHMRSVAGHNVLQVGNTPPAALTTDVLASAGQLLTPTGRAAPLTVERLAVAGGAAVVDLSQCYAVVERWRRRVDWDRVAVNVEDEVVLKKADLVQLRWHLGLAADARRTLAAGRVQIGDIQLSYDSDQPLAVAVEAMPDATLEPGKIHEHACVVLRSAQPVSQLKLKTRVSLAPGVAGAGP